MKALRLQDWLLSLCALLILAAVVTLSIHSDVPGNPFNTDKNALLLTLAMSCSWLGALLMPTSANTSVSLTSNAVWSVATAVGFLALLMTPIYPGFWTEGWVPAAGVALQVLLFSTLLQAFGAHWRNESKAKIFLALLIAVATAAPLYLSNVFGQTESLINLTIAVSPVSYLAVLADYDYLRSGWFYEHTPFGGLRYDYYSAWTLTSCYGIAITAVAAVALYGNTLSRNALTQGLAKKRNDQQ